MIIEIKSSIADFRADRKWVDYRDFADRFYFAVPKSFPVALIPEHCGLIVADAFAAALIPPRDCMICSGAGGAQARDDARQMCDAHIEHHRVIRPCE